MTQPDNNIVTQYHNRLKPESKLAVLQEKAMHDFKQHGLPTVKHEEWRYTRIGSSFKSDMALGQHAELSAADVNSFRLPGDAIEIFFVNGVFQSASQTDEVTIQSLDIAAAGEYAQIVKDNLGHSSQYHPDGINALNTAFVNGGVFIHVRAGKQVSKPIYVYHVNHNKTVPTLALPRTLIYVGRGSGAEVTEHHVSLGSHETLTNMVTEIIVEQDAVVNFYKIQNEGSHASQVSTTHFRQIGKALCNATTISLSGNIVRNNLNMVMEAEHGESHMYGLYLLDGKTHVDNHTIVDNVMPHCFSNELYKGIMDGASTGVFNGKIFVRQDAQKTNAYQSNKNVLLSNDASVNTKPQLEIFADDVKCSHGCTVGKLDEAALFYLRARGIGEKAAKSLLLHAFAVDILDNIKAEPLREYVDQIISERLEFNF
ncbi:MAG: Fe-S cluster assembly protein SufD [Chitinophagaceae bacterium]